MSRNPVFEFLRRHGASRATNSRSIPIIGGAKREFEWRPTIQYIQPFTYFPSTFANENAIVENLLLNPHPTDILADSSLFSPKRIDLVRQLLIARKVCILPAVQKELTDLAKRPSALKDLVFPEGKLNPRLELLPYPGIAEYGYVASRYVNILHFRKRFLEGPLRRYQEKHGREAAGKDRAKIIQDWVDQGVSRRTLRMANKGDPRRRYTDETLVVYGVLSPILTGRDCFVLTADRDVFDQFFQFTQLLYDDYGSYLIADDFRKYPERYKHSHEWVTAFMWPGAVTIGRPSEPVELLPLLRRTCAAWVIDVDSLDFMSWVAIREIEAALRFQETAHDGRVGDGGNGLNVHISLGDPTCKAAPAHFTIGRDVIRVDAETKLGRIRISDFDLFRAASDMPPSFVSQANLHAR